MALVHRRRFILTQTNQVIGWSLLISVSSVVADVIEDVAAVSCYRCRTIRDDRFVYINIDSADKIDRTRVYHRGCIPPVTFHQLAGSLPASVA